MSLGLPVYEHRIDQPSVYIFRWGDGRDPEVMARLAIQPDWDDATVRGQVRQYMAGVGEATYAWIRSADIHKFEVKTRTEVVF